MASFRVRRRIRAQHLYRFVARRRFSRTKRARIGRRIWKALNSAFVLWALSTVVVGAVTYYLDKQHKESAEHLTATIDLVPHLASDNVVASVIAQTILRDSAISKETYAKTIKAVMDITARNAEDQNRIVAFLAAADRVPGVSAAIMSSLPARVYVHIPQRLDPDPFYKVVQDTLQPRGFVVLPPIPVSIGPQTDQVRYFDDASKGTAEEIARALQRSNIGLTPVTTRIPSAQAHPGQFEIWIGARRAGGG